MSQDTIRATGTLANGPLGPVLRVDGGGEWEVDHTGDFTQLIGQRVEVVGRRAGYNGLICDEIWHEGSPRPHGRRLSAEFWMLAAFVIFGLAASFKSLFD